MRGRSPGQNQEYHHGLTLPQTVKRSGPKKHKKMELEKAYRAFMGRCCERIKWIMFQDMCALIVVRNAVVESSECPGAEIIDCDVDFWVGKQCTVKCDDSCPDVPDPTEVYEPKQTNSNRRPMPRVISETPLTTCGVLH